VRLFRPAADTAAVPTSEALDRASPNNWLDDNIWLKKAYHEWRAPLLVNSNWWLAFQYDHTVPSDILLGSSSERIIGSSGINKWQIRRAAWLVYRILDFKAQLQRCVGVSLTIVPRSE
jgi:hypothetical protein